MVTIGKNRQIIISNEYNKQHKGNASINAKVMPYIKKVKTKKNDDRYTAVNTAFISSLSHYYYLALFH